MVEEVDEEPIPPVYDGKAGARIKSLRATTGLSQRLFADKAGVDASMISEVEAGNRELSLKAAKKIGSAFEVGFEWLLYGCEDRRDFPVDEKMIEWLWQNEDVRKELRSRMRNTSKADR